MPRRLSPEKRDRILSLLHKDVPAGDIAKTLGVSVSAVSRLRNGIGGMKRRRAKPRRTVEDAPDGTGGNRCDVSFHVPRPDPLGDDIEIRCDDLLGHDEGVDGKGRLRTTALRGFVIAWKLPGVTDL